MYVQQGWTFSADLPERGPSTAPLADLDFDRRNFLEGFEAVLAATQQDRRTTVSHYGAGDLADFCGSLSDTLLAPTPRPRCPFLGCAAFHLSNFKHIEPTDGRHTSTDGRRSGSLPPDIDPTRRAVPLCPPPLVFVCILQYPLPDTRYAVCDTFDFFQLRAQLPRMHTRISP